MLQTTIGRPNFIGGAVEAGDQRRVIAGGHVGHDERERSRTRDGLLARSLGDEGAFALHAGYQTFAFEVAQRLADGRPRDGHQLSELMFARQRVAGAELAGGNLPEQLRSQLAMLQSRSSRATFRMQPRPLLRVRSLVVALGVLMVTYNLS